MKVQISGEGGYIVSASRREFPSAKSHWPSELILGVVGRDGSIDVWPPPYGTQTRGDKPPPSWYADARRLLNSPAARSAILAGLKAYRKETKKTGLHVVRLSDGRRNAFSTVTQAVAWGQPRLKKMRAGSAMGLFHGGPSAGVYRDAPHTVYAVNEHGRIEHSQLTNWAKAVAKHESGGNPRVRAQEEHFTHAHAKAAGADQTMLDLLYGPNPITDDELRKLIAKRPHVYGKYAAYLGKRGSGAKHESGGNPRVKRSKAPKPKFESGEIVTSVRVTQTPDLQPVASGTSAKIVRRDKETGRYFVLWTWSQKTGWYEEDLFESGGAGGLGGRHERGGNPRVSRPRDPLKIAHEQGFESAILARERVREKYNRLIRESEAKYGSHGPLVSGVVREHFPPGVKARLRALANDMNALGEAALTHHRGTGRRRHYSTLKDQVLKDRVNALVGKKS